MQQVRSLLTSVVSCCAWSLKFLKLNDMGGRTWKFHLNTSSRRSLLDCPSLKFISEIKITYMEGQSKLLYKYWVCISCSSRTSIFVAQISPDSQLTLSLEEEVRRGGHGLDFEASSFSFLLRNVLFLSRRR